MSNNLGAKLFRLLLSCFAFIFLDVPTRGASIDWIRQFGSPVLDYGWGISADGLGAVYVTGITYGDIAGSNSGGEDAYLAKYDATGTQIWSRQFGPARGNVVSADGVGGVYVAGDDAEGGFVAKYDISGNLLWTQHSANACSGVSSDGLGSVYTAGITTPSSGTNGFDAFVSRYDSSGNPIWTKQLASSENDEAWSASADGLGNVYVAGRTSGALAGASTGGYDAFVAKYSSLGSLLWTRQFGTANYDEAMGVAADALGNVYVTGSAGSDYIHDIQPYAYVAKFDPLGNSVWTRQLDSGTGDISSSASTDGQGNVYVAGITSGNLGGPPISNYDAFVAKYDNSGNLLGIQQFAVSGKGTVVWNASADGHGSVYITGNASVGWTSEEHFDPTDVFVAKLSDTPEPGSLVLMTFGFVSLFPRLLHGRVQA